MADPSRRQSGVGKSSSSMRWCRTRRRKRPSLPAMPRRHTTTARRTGSARRRPSSMLPACGTSRRREPGARGGARFRGNPRLERRVPFQRLPPHRRTGCAVRSAVTAGRIAARATKATGAFSGSTKSSRVGGAEMTSETAVRPPRRAPACRHRRIRVHRPRVRRARCARP